MIDLVVSGNPEYGLAGALYKIYPHARFFSRRNGCDLTTDAGRETLCDAVLTCDVFVNCSALWRFNQTILLEQVYNRCLQAKHDVLIVAIGSTIDRTRKGGSWLYPHEKHTLRQYANSLNIQSTWHGGPQVTQIGFGSLSNVQHKHTDRICMDCDTAASYIKWIIDQPRHLVINEISIDPRQKVSWHE